MNTATKITKFVIFVYNLIHTHKTKPFVKYYHHTQNLQFCYFCFKNCCLYVIFQVRFKFFVEKTKITNFVIFVLIYFVRNAQIRKSPFLLPNLNLTKITKFVIFAFAIYKNSLVQSYY